MASKYVLYEKPELKQPYHWVLKASNNEIILTSENYVTRAGALNGIESVQNNCEDSSNYKKLTSIDNQPYFTLNSPDNGQVIGKSEMYSSEEARDNGIKSVKENGTTTLVEEV